MSSVFTGVISKVLSFLMSLLFFLFKVGFICVMPFATACIVYFIYYKIKGYTPIIDNRGKWEVPHMLYRLFVLLPKQIILDHFTLDPNTFKEYGVHVVEGEQGSGKTVTMVYLLKKFRTIYPNIKIFTNMEYKYQDGVLNDLSQLSLDTNGVYGEIDVIDELQSVLDSSFSKNFPVELLSIICQQRKVRRCILSSTQNFPRLAKQLREQTNFIYRPLTLFGCLTIVRVYKAKLDENANFIDKDNKPIKIFFFVHDDDLRNSYDSYKTVDLIKVSKDKKSKGVA